MIFKYFYNKRVIHKLFETFLLMGGKYMKIWKRMITVIVAAMMMLCVVPAWVSADEKLPTPTGLKWNTEHNFPMMGI